MWYLANVIREIKICSFLFLHLREFCILVMNSFERRISKLTMKQDVFVLAATSQKLSPLRATLMLPVWLCHQTVSPSYWLMKVRATLTLPEWLCHETVSPHTGQWKWGKWIHYIWNTCKYFSENYKCLLWRENTYWY